MKTGIVKWFNATTGIGVILSEENEEFSFNYSDINADGFKALDENDRVEFELKEDKDDVAVNITKLI